MSGVEAFWGTVLVGSALRRKLGLVWALSELGFVTV